MKEGDNVLAVRIDHSRYADSRWYTGSGIYRDVWLVAASETHLAQWGVGWHATSITDRQAVDENGTVVKLGDNDITCTVEGPARLLGLEGSNNSDMSDYTDNHHRVYHGRLLAYVQTTGEKGQIRVKFTSPLLQGAELVLNVE